MMTFRWMVPLSAGLLIATAAACAGADDGYCPNAQSPRNVDPDAHPSPYQLTGPTSFVGLVADGSAVYLPRPGGPPQTLHRCGQHYHFPIENPEGCDGEMAAGDQAAAAGAAGAAHPDPPPPGSRVEIHTVYAANETAPPGCDPETLGCCTDPPFLVLAFSATVKPGDDGPAIVTPPGFPRAEWSGSTTGKEAKPGECKPAAMWSVRLGCDFTVTTAQLRQFKHADPARPVQEGDRLSRDLTLVKP